MLRTGLIGFPSVGKTTLFQLMTSQPDAPRGAHGRLEAAVVVARVPVARLDRLTAMFKPHRRVPATVEFADIGGMGRAAAQALPDVAPFRNADALVHVVRAFRDESIAHAPSDINPARDAQAMEDELILADLARIGEAPRSDRARSQEGAYPGARAGARARSFLTCCTDTFSRKFDADCIIIL